VEDVTGQQNSDAEEEEDAHQEAGPSTMTRKTKGKRQYKYHHAKRKK
jgi:hypothetical protein